LHPFMPFVTEDIYQLLKEQKTDLVVAQLSPLKNADTDLLKAGTYLKELISSIRDARNKNQLKPKDPVRLHIETNEKGIYSSISGILSKQVNAESIAFANGSVANSITVVVQTDKIFIETTTELDTTAQKEQLIKDLTYLKGFLLSVEKKLSNEKFVQNAKPEIIDSERKKKSDAEAKIKVIEESLASLC
jgi:valyl-tRNA synthetase